MKIAILGPYTFPDNYSIKDVFSSDEKFYFNNEHTHPWISNLARGLAKIGGNEIHIIMLIPGIKSDKKVLLNDVYYHFLKTTSKTIQALSLLNSNKIKVHRYFRNLNPDIVHGQSRGRDSYLAVTSGFPNVITNHGQIDEHYDALGYKKDLKYKIAKRFESKVNRKMKWCITVSPNCTDDCKKYISENNIIQIDNPVNYLFFEEYNLKFKNKIIYIGNITRLKRVLELVKAIELTEKTELLIIPNIIDSDYFQVLKSYVEHHNLTNRIKFTAKLSQDKLAPEIAECTALCLPSAYESFGMVLAEAMAVGIPVIAGMAGGMSYVVKNNETGFLIETDNVKQLAERIEYLAGNKNKAVEMGKNARAEAFKRWHPDIVAEKTYEVYKKVLRMYDA